MYKMKDKMNYMFNPTKPGDKAELVLDLSKLGPDDEDTQHDTFKWSKDGKYMAFVTNQNGSDWKKIRVVDLASGKEIKDVIERVKFSGPSWDPDSQGFFYGRYDSTEEK
jgi:prolyl oligopeptidase